MSSADVDDGGLTTLHFRATLLAPAPPCPPAPACSSPPPSLPWARSPLETNEKEVCRPDAWCMSVIRQEIETANKESNNSLCATSCPRPCKWSYVCLQWRLLWFPHQWSVLAGRIPTSRRATYPQQTPQPTTCSRNSLHNWASRSTVMPEPAIESRASLLCTSGVCSLFCTSWNTFFLQYDLSNWVDFAATNLLARHRLTKGEGHAVMTGDSGMYTGWHAPGIHKNETWQSRFILLHHVTVAAFLFDSGSLPFWNISSRLCVFRLRGVWASFSPASPKHSQIALWRNSAMSLTLSAPNSRIAIR